MYLIINNSFIDIQPLKHICLVWILSSSMRSPSSFRVCNMFQYVFLLLPVTTKFLFIPPVDTCFPTFDIF